MKNQTILLPAIFLAALAAGCKPADSTDASASGSANPPPSALQTAKDYANAAVTNTVSTATQAWTGLKVSVQLAMGYTFDKKDEFVAKTSADIAELDRKIQDLSDQAAQTTDATKASLQEKLQQLRARRVVLEQKLTKVKNATEPDWEATKADFKSACDDVEAAFEDAWHSLKGN